MYSIFKIYTGLSLQIPLELFSAENKRMICMNYIRITFVKESIFTKSSDSRAAKNYLLWSNDLTK